MSSTFKTLKLSYMGRLQFIKGTFKKKKNYHPIQIERVRHTHQNKIRHSSTNNSSFLKQTYLKKKKKDFSVHFIYFLQDHIPTFIYIYIYM